MFLGLKPREEVEMRKYGKEYQSYLERLVKTGHRLAMTYGNWLKSAKGKLCIKQRQKKDKKREGKWQAILTKLNPTY